MNILRFISFFSIVIGLMLMVSCEYEFIEVPAPPTPPDPDDTTVHKISFSQSIEPIFTNDNCTDCHSGSSSSAGLDLSVGNAYNSMFSNNVVLPGDPTNSSIYYYPHPVTGSHNSRYSAVAETDSIYLWIYQGALDN